MFAFVLGFVTAVSFLTSVRSVNADVCRWANRGYVFGGMTTAILLCGGM